LTHRNYKNSQEPRNPRGLITGTDRNPHELKQELRNPQGLTETDRNSGTHTNSNRNSGTQEPTGTHRNHNNSQELLGIKELTHRN
jgi:hypothetical protein